MNHLELLRQSLIEAYKTTAVITKIEKNINDLAKEIITEKYKDVVLRRDGLEHQFCDIRYSYISREDSFTDGVCKVALIYFCKSNLPKAKEEEVKKKKKNI